MRFIFEFFHRPYAVIFIRAVLTIHCTENRVIHHVCWNRMRFSERYCVTETKIIQLITAVASFFGDT